MRSILVLLSLSCALVYGRRRLWHELEGYTFEEYVKDYHLKLYDNQQEYARRKEIFSNELVRLKKHNSENRSWKEGVNKFSHMTVEEKKAFLGRSKGIGASLKPKYQVDFDVSSYSKPASALPRQVDWRDSDVMTAVKDQGGCGSCWAFASTATLESHVALATGALFDLSVQQFTSCAPNPNACGGTGGCGGATAELAYEYLAGDAGILEEFQYGYSSYSGTTGTCEESSKGDPVAAITGYVQLPMNNYTAVLNAVSTVGPIAINVDASTWSAYESGIFDGCNQSSPDVNHVVVLAGYGEDNGDKYWLVRNSWNPTWGEQGYIRLARSDSDEEKCGMDVTPQDGIACSDVTEPARVCGTCGVIYDGVYPVGASLL